MNINRRDFLKTAGLITGGILLGLNPFKKKPLSNIGKTYFVDSKHGKDTKLNGLSPNQPFATINYATEQCVANRNDTIFVMSDHIESTNSVIEVNTNTTLISLSDNRTRPAFISG